MAGHEQRHRLVADLLRRSSGVPSSASCACSSIESRSPRSSPLARRVGDDAVDDPVEAADRPARAEVGRGRHPVREPTQQARSADAEVVRSGPPAAWLASCGVAGDVGVEERLGHDGLGQRHHLRAHVPRRRRPSRRPRGARRRRPSPRRRPATRWRWKAGCTSRRWRSQVSPSESSSPSPSTGREQAHAGALDEVAVPGHEQLLDGVRVEDQEDAVRPHPRLDEVAVLPRAR